MQPSSDVMSKDDVQHATFRGAGAAKSESSGGDDAAVNRLGGAFAAFLGEPEIECVVIGSVVAGLHLMLHAAGIEQGDEILATGHGGAVMAGVVQALGSVLKLVDIDPVTLNMGISALKVAITPSARAIIVTHHAGLAADMLSILDLAVAHQLRVIENASEALSATLEKELVGALGGAATFFGISIGRGLNTAQAGILITRNALLTRQMRVRLSRTMSDVDAIDGLWQLEHVRDLRCRRAQIAARFNAAFAGLPLILPPRAPMGDMHAWQRYVLRLTDMAPVSQAAMIRRLLAAGVSLLQPVERLSDGRSPQFQRAFELTVDLALGVGLTDDDVEQGISAVRSCLAH